MKRHTFKAIAQVVFVLAIIAGLLGLIAGCSMDSPVRSDAPHLHEVFLDISDPTPNVIEAHLMRGFNSQRMLPPGTLVRFYTFAGNVQRVYEGGPIRNTDDFFEQVTVHVQKRIANSTKETETRTEKVLALVAVNAASRERYGVFLATDGGVEDLSRPVLQSVKESAQVLAENKSVAQIVVSGVLSQHQLRWTKWLEPLGGRAYVRSESDLGRSTPRYWEELP